MPVALLERETNLAERSYRRQRITLTTLRLVEEQDGLFHRRAMVSIPLEQIAGIEERATSNPALAFIGLVVTVLGFNLGGYDIQNGGGVVLVGVLLLAAFALSFRRGVEFRSAGGAVFLAGTGKDLAAFIHEVEQARWRLLRLMHGLPVDTQYSMAGEQAEPVSSD